MLKPHGRIVIPLDKTPERDGRTDRQTDRQTDRYPLAITAVCIRLFVYYYAVAAHQ